jgi:hypothetical protein
MSDIDYRPRLSVEITEEDQTRIQKLIPWGILSPVMRALLEDVLDLVEQHGEIALALFISKKVRAKDLLKARMKEGQDAYDRGFKSEHKSDDGSGA